MRNTLAAAGILALGLVARALMPATAQADPYGPNFAQVCCGNQCKPDDYCTGTGDYKCCK
jgi:hypothetical protein